jgi:predicted ATPase/DNA-binding SARP family transcriptional activator
MAGATNLQVQLLGGFAARIGDQQVPATFWRQRRAAAVVKLLALEAGHWLHREHLQDALWPDLDPEDAANNLRGALHHARRGLETAGAPANTFLHRDRDGVLLGPPDHVLVDVDAFTEAVSRAWQSPDPLVAEQAAALYRGALLPEDPYEDWAEARREGLRASFLTVLTRLARLHEERGEFAQAVAARQRALVADPLDEATHADLMRLHAQMGNAALALAQYARLQTLLERELGVSPEPETRELAVAIREGRLKPASPAPLAAAAPLAPPTPGILRPEPGALPAPPVPLSVTVAPSARVPAAVDSLIGRARELAELERLLDSARLVTLTGPGGTGKTRLAQEVARAIGQRFPGGVAYVELAPLRDPALVLLTIARALGVEESGDTPMVNLLAAAIGDKRLLLVLDNLEQVAAAAADLAALLASCPGLALLTTSRMRLRLRGEHEYPVAPLALPPVTATGQVTPSAIEQTPAVALFLNRAREARPGFTLTPENLEAVVAVCRRLDGLPLAIELAAARVRVLAPNQLLPRLEHSLDVLGTTARDVPAHQRTLRDTLAWSHELLTPGEQSFFRRLSVFVGGWTLEAAEAVASAAGDEPATLETLARLIDQSLVTMRGDVDDDESRFTMLETIREFATEQLAASGEAELVERAFAEFLIARAEAAEEGLKGPDQRLWLDRLEAEHDNLRAALGRAVERKDGEVALRLALRLWQFWWTHGYWREGRDWLERTLTVAGSADVAGRAAAEFGLGQLWLQLGDYDAAEAHFRQSLDARRQLGDAMAEAEVLSALAMIAFNWLAFDAARTLGEDALKIARESGDRRSVATALRILGMIAREQGQFERALGLLEESMALGRALGDAAWTARVATQMGIAYRLAGNPEQAQHFLDSSREVQTDLGDQFALGVIASNSGHLAFDAGDVTRAVALYAEALRYFDSVGDPEGFVEAIEWLAMAAVAKEQAVPALRLFGAAAAAREALHLPPRIVSDEKRFASGLDQAMRAAGTSATMALAAGRALSLERARDEALDLARVDMGPANVDQ